MFTKDALISNIRTKLHWKYVDGKYILKQEIAKVQ